MTLADMVDGLIRMLPQAFPFTAVELMGLPRHAAAAVHVAVSVLTLVTILRARSSRTFGMTTVGGMGLGSMVFYRIVVMAAFFMMGGFGSWIGAFGFSGILSFPTDLLLARELMMRNRKALAALVMLSPVPFVGVIPYLATVAVSRLADVRPTVAGIMVGKGKAWVAYTTVQLRDSFEGLRDVRKEWILLPAKDYPIHWSPEGENGELNAHLIVAGKSGSGKTTFLYYLITQLLERGHGVTVIDMTGQYHEFAIWLQHALGSAPKYKEGEERDPRITRELERILGRPLATIYLCESCGTGYRHIRPKRCPTQITETKRCGSTRFRVLSAKPLLDLVRADVYAPLSGTEGERPVIRILPVVSRGLDVLVPVFNEPDVEVAQDLSYAMGVVSRSALGVNQHYYLQKAVEVECYRARKEGRKPRLSGVIEVLEEFLRRDFRADGTLAEREAYAAVMSLVRRLRLLSLYLEPDGVPISMEELEPRSNEAGWGELVVVDLSSIKDDDIRTIAAELLLRKLKTYIQYRRPKRPYRLKWFLVIDEAWRILKAQKDADAGVESRLEWFYRVGRNHGVAIIALTQLATDMGEEARNADAQIFFNLASPEDIQDLIAYTGAKVLETIGGRLGPHVALITTRSAFDHFVRATQYKGTAHVWLAADVAKLYIPREDLERANGIVEKVRAAERARLKALSERLLLEETRAEVAAVEGKRRALPCPSCGRACEPWAKYCPWCGAALQQTRKSQRAEAVNRPVPESPVASRMAVEVPHAIQATTPASPKLASTPTSTVETNGVDGPGVTPTVMTEAGEGVTARDDGTLDELRRSVEELRVLDDRVLVAACIAASRGWVVPKVQGGKLVGFEDRAPEDFRRALEEIGLLNGTKYRRAFIKAVGLLARDGKPRELAGRVSDRSCHLCLSYPVTSSHACPHSQGVMRGE